MTMHQWEVVGTLRSMSGHVQKHTEHVEAESRLDAEVKAILLADSRNLSTSLFYVSYVRKLTAAADAPAASYEPLAEDDAS